VPVSDSAPEKGGDEGDIVTLIAPTTVPDGAPPVKLLPDRLTAVIACAAVTVILRFWDVLVASHDLVGMAKTETVSNQIKTRRILIPLLLCRYNSDVLGVVLASEDSPAPVVIRLLPEIAKVPLSLE
jgi:hypothetical protein